MTLGLWGGSEGEAVVYMRDGEEHPAVVMKVSRNRNKNNNNKFATSTVLQTRKVVLIVSPNLILIVVLLIF